MQIENIGNEKYLLVYCDRIAGSKDKTGIYYSVFDGTWSEPKLISSPENGSTEPYLINTNDKAYVAWTDVKSVDIYIYSTDLINRLQLKYTKMLYI